MDDQLNEILNKEIVREILIQEEANNVDDALVDKIWAACGNNPWNAAVMYGIFKLTGKL